VGILALVLYFLVSPSINLLQKPAYPEPEFSIRYVDGHSVIRLTGHGGNPGYFHNATHGSYRLAIYVDTPQRTYRTIPQPALAVMNPGDSVFIYYTGSGFRIARDPAGIPFPPLPDGRLHVRIVDPDTDFLIGEQEFYSAQVTPTAVPTLMVPYFEKK